MQRRRIATPGFGAYLALLLSMIPLPRLHAELRIFAESPGLVPQQLTQPPPVTDPSSSEAFATKAANGEAIPQDRVASALDRIEAEEPLASTSPEGRSEVPEVPGLSNLPGFNAGFSFSGVHDSSVGWSTIFTPALSYSFNDIFSIDASIPIYMFRLAQSRSVYPRPGKELVGQRGEPGDLLFGLHAQFLPKFADYQLTASFTVPTGDELYGLSSGRVTFDISNRFERTFSRFSPNLEIGAGDSSGLVNQLVTKNYTSLGPLAHFQVGVGVSLPLHLSFESDVYEQLPIGDQKIYTSTTRRKVTTTVATGRSISEDNGFINSLDLSAGGNATFSTYYQRSLRLKNDSVGVALTFVLRSTQEKDEPSDKDLFRE